MPVANCLGREGTGFITAMKTFDVSRPGVGAQALGIAQGSFDLALEYACTRRQFDAPIGSFQGLRFMMADMAMKIEAARPGLRHGAAHRPPAQGTAYAL